MKQRTVLKIDDIPYRTEKLELSKIQSIFGGCGGEGAACEVGKDCCDNHGCDTIPPFEGKCHANNKNGF